MRVDLNGHSVAAARATAQRFLEATIPERRFSVPKRILRIERERMRQKRDGTRKARVAIESMLEVLRARIRSALPLREASGDAESEAQRVRAYHKMQAAVMDEAAGIPIDLLATTLGPYLEEALDAGRTSARGELGLGFEVKNHQAMDALYQQELKFSKTFVTRETAALKDILFRALDEGLPAREAAKQIRDEFTDGIHYVADDGSIERVLPDETWALMVARTEISRANNTGVYGTYIEQGVSYVRWMTAEDERACPECLDLDGEVAKVGEPFSDGSIMPPDPHQGCRCATVADWSFLDEKSPSDQGDA